MSLGIAIKGPEGIVLAAESRTTLTVTVERKDTGEKQQYQVNYDNATKVFAFEEPNTMVGVVTYGMAAMQDRSAYSFLPEFQTELGATSGERLGVEDFACRFSDFFLRQWQALMPGDFAGPGMTFVVGGFDPGEAYGRVYLIEIPNAPSPALQGTELKEFGITWGGQREFVDRLLQGYDARLLAIVQTLLKLNGPQMKELTESLGQLQMAIALPAMALQDCIDLAILFIRTTIEVQRLTLGVRGCGGPIDVATITRQRGFEFVQRKRLEGERAWLGEGPY